MMTRVKTMATFGAGNREGFEDAFFQAGKSCYLDQVAISWCIFVKGLRSLHLKFLHCYECLYSEILKKVKKRNSGCIFI